jgi:hypothetical protein
MTARLTDRQKQQAASAYHIMRATGAGRIKSLMIAVSIGKALGNVALSPEDKLRVIQFWATVETMDAIT